MKKIILMRHGISEGNKDRIIQGELNYKLSDEGVRELKTTNMDDVKGITGLYSSDLDRAIQTAEIVKETIRFDGKILKTDILRENSFGILNGLTKIEAKEMYPDFYETYLKRGDMDTIPSANDWKYNQSRALAFIQKYIGQEEYNDLIVSHGAFIRIMYNLCMGRNRNERLDDIVNCRKYVINNPLDNLDIHKIEIAKTSEVFKITSFDNDYILKRYDRRIEKKDYLEKDLLDYLSKYGVSPYYYYINDCFEKCVKVMKYEKGIHKFDDLTISDLKSVLKVLKQMSGLLKKYDDSKFNDGNILLDLQKSQDNLFTEDAKKICYSLISDEKFNNYLLNSKKCLVHNDLHRSNILFDNNQVRILDFDNIKKYPEDLQIATFICSFLVLENKYDYQDILDKWSETMDVDIIDKLIKYRLIYGLSFFENKIKMNDYNDEDLLIRKKYMRGLHL